jgi:hypothetical protein
MRKLPSVCACVVSMLFLVASVSEAQLNLTGTWVGTYQYGAECLNYRGTETLVLTDESGVVTGTVSDVTISPVSGLTAFGLVSGGLGGLTYQYLPSPVARLVISHVDDSLMIGRIVGVCGNGADVTFLRQGGPSIDLSIVDVVAAQVVYGPPRLVADKPMAFRVRVSASPCMGRPATVPVELKVTALGATHTYNGSVPSGDFHPGASGGCVADIHLGIGYVPAKGDLDFLATVDPANVIAEGDNNNNSSASKRVEVKRTRGLRIVYVRIDGCGAPTDQCYAAPGTGTIPSTIAFGNDFVSDVFPISRANFSGVLAQRGIRGTTVGTAKAMDDDLRTLVRYARTQVDPFADFVVGIVGHDYFAFHQAFVHGAPPSGATHPGIPAVLIESGRYDTVAHELGHLFGLYAGRFSPEEYSVTYNGNPAIGFSFPTSGAPKEIKNAICMMGNGTGTPWIDEADYITLLTSPRFKDPTDPESLLLMGEKDHSGQVAVASMDYLPNANLTEDIIEDGADGHLTTRVRAADGSLLSETTAPYSFFARLEPFGTVETDTAPFTFIVPYGPDVRTIEIVENGVVTQSLAPGALLLRDAIQRLSEASFNNRDRNARRALLNHVDVFEKHLGRAQTGQAAIAALNVIHGMVERVLTDRPKDFPLEMTKGELLELIATVGLRLE